MRGNYRRPFVKRDTTRINERITAPTVRLLDEEAKQIGVVTIDEARKIASERELDLVEIAGAAQPPVVKVIDYKKYLYQLKKKKQEEKRNTHTSETKQIQLGPFIGDHDLEIKTRHGREFLEDGDKVKFIVKFRGRQMSRTELGAVVLRKVIEQLADISKVEREIKLEGRQMSLVVVRDKGAKKNEQKIES